MTRAIVGYTGFVGSNIVKSFKFDKFYNSKNFHEAQNCEFDELFFVALPAEKWRANKFPDDDFLNIGGVPNKQKLLFCGLDYQRRAF